MQDLIERLKADVEHMKQRHTWHVVRVVDDKYRYNSDLAADIEALIQLWERK